MAPLGRRQERREERRTFRPGGDAIQYEMREKLASIGEDFWIETSHGDKVFKVDGKALRVRSTLVFEDAHGNQLAQIQDRPARVRDMIEIENPDGSNLATVKKAMISPLRDRYTVSVADGDDLEVQGNIVDHEYDISAGGNKVAEVSKKWFRVRDTYGVQVEPDQSPILILAVTVAVDTMSS